MVFLYNLSIRLYQLLVNFASLFNTKAKLFRIGRKNIWEKISKQIDPANPPIWIHCSSLGEFEQGRPVIEAIKQKDPNKKILLTFFSPSGYEVRKNYPGADYIFYLPLDTKRNAKRFINLINPQMAIFVKYEFWYHYLNVLKQRNISTYLVSGIFRSNQIFFKPYGKWYRNFLKAFSTFFVQNNTSKALLESIGYSNVVVTGDTRYDRVSKIASEAKDIPLVKIFAEGHKVLVAGSTWPKDEEIILPLAKEIPDLKIIVVPHEIEESHIQEIIRKSPTPPVRFTDSDFNNAKESNILIVDTIGLLSSIYQYATVAYIGGGFGAGIHNTLEAAVYGVPVIFGPNYNKFQEAKDLIDKKAGFSIKSYNEFKNLLNSLLSHKNTYQLAANQAKELVNSGVGATQKIIELIF
ncbi:3-deoxy-D-manno-octulosonic acid transferase [Tenuifilum thalassicum]|uniref:3-deoxy-D-manno-octulosonic acid transferase n=1 Tax=Tenuifilum thalassicum TaxID=2590900 RepID=A0A7D3XTV3_9BACT|nr:glycosyltransferase N-terminal domain-containing protein [Tenuifilum thalassicum]QKG79171.1 3-deoxy-D-manno-octulosonic acid transferase [Tenuifilum thalassicum]